MSPSAPPAGIQGSSEVFAVSGMDTTITAFTDVTGNPTPNSTWARNGSPLQASGMMYGTDSTGVLMISNVMLADSGNYTNTLHNMFNNQSFTNNHTISLQVLREWTKCQQTLFIIILILRLCQYATKSYCYKHHFKCCCLEVAKSY